MGIFLMAPGKCKQHGREQYIFEIHYAVGLIIHTAYRGDDILFIPFSTRYHALNSKHLYLELSLPFEMNGNAFYFPCQT